KHVSERVAERTRFAREQMGAPLDNGRGAAETADGLRDLDPDRAAAEHEEPLRNRLHPGRLTVRPDAVELPEARERRYERVWAVGENDVVGGVRPAVDLDDASPLEAPVAAEQIDPVLGEPALRPGIRVVRDHEVAPRKRLVHVDPRRRSGLV